MYKQLIKASILVHTTTINEMKTEKAIVMKFVAWENVSSL